MVLKYFINDLYALLIPHFSFTNSQTLCGLMRVTCAHIYMYVCVYACIYVYTYIYKPIVVHCKSTTQVLFKNNNKVDKRLPK